MITGSTSYRVPNAMLSIIYPSCHSILTTSLCVRQLNYPFNKEGCEAQSSWGPPRADVRSKWGEPHEALHTLLSDGGGCCCCCLPHHSRSPSQNCPCSTLIQLCTPLLAHILASCYALLLSLSRPSLCKFPFFTKLPLTHWKWDAHCLWNRKYNLGSSPSHS